MVLVSPVFGAVGVSDFIIVYGEWNSRNDRKDRRFATILSYRNDLRTIWTGEQRLVLACDAC